MATDRAADVQRRRPRHAKVGEQERASPLGQADWPGRVVAGFQHPHADIRQRDALQPQDPRGVGLDRHQGGPRRNDRMPELGRPTVAVARRTAAGIRLPSGRKDDGLRPQRPLGSDDPQAGRIGRDRLHGLVGGQRATTSVESCQQGCQDIVGPVAHGKDFSARLDLRGNPLGFDQIDELVGPQGGQGRMEKRPLGAKSLDETAYIQGVGEVAARPAGHEDFGAGTFFLLQEQGPPSPLGRPAGRHQAGRSPSNDDDFPVFHAAFCCIYRSRLELARSIPTQSANEADHARWQPPLRKLESIRIVDLTAGHLSRRNQIALTS